MQLSEQAVCDLLARGQALVIATIVNRRGATPRSAGSKMVITSNGRGIGTIGGGLLEAKVIARATQLFPQERSDLIHFDLSGDLISESDMVCGGTADVLLAFVPPSESNRELFAQWCQGLVKRQGGCLVAVAQQKQDQTYETTFCMTTPEEEVVGQFPLDKASRNKVLNAAKTATPIQTIWFDKTLVIVEPSIKAKIAYLFGAGHVAQPTAHLAAEVGFQVWVLDDRETYANPERFPWAHRVRVLDDFECAFKNLVVTSDSYIIIFTRGHLHDKIILARALNTDAGYIGMIGSKHKRDTIYAALQAEGATPEQIARVHSPIGLSIGAETPQEIAVSIVAEMILHRSQGIV